jgi:flagellar hook-associated protein 3 FlgL
MRISTSQSWNSAMLNLLEAQGRQTEANNQVSTGKIATDLGGFGRDAQVIAGHQSVKMRIDGFSEISKSVGQRLDVQNLALERAGDSINGAREAILTALANGRVDTLMTELSAQFSSLSQGLNTQYEGQFLFGGGNESGKPLAVSTLDDLTIVPVADTFVNGTVKKASQIDTSTTLQTGMLASDLGMTSVDLFRQIKTFANSSAPFTGQMDEPTRTFLENMATQFSSAYDKMLDATALNGTHQNTVEKTVTALKKQSDGLQGLISDKTDVDLTEAYVRLEQAQTAVQASARVVANLRDNTLLDYLR